MSSPSPPDGPTKPIRFLMLGGFLGSGKTTTIARLAKRFHAQGKKVAIVTNDKAADLVDTLSLRAQGFTVGELPGVCFCGNVDELVEMIRAIGVFGRPDVVIAEPVGSCLDMFATVIEPLRRSCGGEFEIAPLGVLVKPTHAAKILRGEEEAGVSPKAAYIFRKQLEEADFVVVNRVDRLQPEEIETIVGLLRDRFPELPVLTMSATLGTGFEGVAELFDSTVARTKPALALDYELYAAGEAELGWLNAGAIVTSTTSFVVDEFLQAAIEAIRDRLRQAGAEASHVKLIGAQGGLFGVANLISSTAEPELSQASRAELSSMHLVVNARVACPPATLQAAIDDGLKSTAEQFACTIRILTQQCFSPGMASAC